VVKKPVNYGFEDESVSRCPAEGGDTLSAYASAAAQAFAQGDGTADAWVKAWAAAIAQYGCDAVKPALAGEPAVAMSNILILRPVWGHC
jgi:hypothetical protein